MPGEAIRVSLSRPATAAVPRSSPSDTPGLDAAGADRFHVVGHDWGGFLAWAVADRHPDRTASLTSLATPHPAAMKRAMLTGDQALPNWQHRSLIVGFQHPAFPVFVARELAGVRTQDGDAVRYEVVS